MMDRIEKMRLDETALQEMDAPLMTFESNIWFTRARGKYRIDSSAKVVLLCV